MLVLGDNFSYQGSKPLDARLKYSTVADMKAVGDATMYDGCMAYCSGTDKTYQWKSTNSVDATTGRWREFSAGSGGSYTAGDGIVIDDDEISIDPMPAEDVDEVIDVYPTAGELVSIVNAFNRSDIYSTDEKMIGQWIDGKPLYSKTINSTTGNTTAQTLISNLGSLNIDTMVSMTGKLVNSGLTVSIPAYLTATGYVGMYYNPSGNSIVAFVGSDWYNQPVTITLQYTKVSDTAISIGSDTDYSTEEKIVGTWIDGKPLYQRVIKTTDLPNNNTKTIALETIMIPRVVLAFANNADGVVFNLPAQTGNVGYTIINHIISLKSTIDMVAYGYTDVIFIIQYTKTTGT